MFVDLQTITNLKKNQNGEVHV